MRHDLKECGNRIVILQKLPNTKTIKTANLLWVI